jgi:predicted nucleic acid-binding protein
MIVVADTSPINYLLLIGHIDILPHFYGRILVPPAVWQELEDTSAPDVLRNWLKSAPEWLELSALTGEPDPSLSFLDRGEQEAIALAEQRQAGSSSMKRSLAKKRSAGTSL